MSNKKQYLTPAQIKAEIEKCLGCPNKPCMKACPVGCSPQEFIGLAKEKKYKEAVEAIMNRNPMGETCGLICPDKFCMSACLRKNLDSAINIPKVQATLMKNYRSFAEKKRPESQVTKNKIAVIGAGPAGLAAAKELAQNGYMTDIFEAKDHIGGALQYIPEERLPHEALNADCDGILSSPLISLQLNHKIENPQELLEQGYSGVIIAYGEQHAIRLNIAGEEFSTCYKDYLSQPEKYKAAQNIAIIGGGNVAVDCALTAKSNGAQNIEIFVRRRLTDMKISRQEFQELFEKEINITALTSPEKIEKNEKLSLYVHRNHIVENKAVPLPDTTIELKGLDLIITAIGSRADRVTEGEKIILAGDCKEGSSTLVEALASGQKAAQKLIYNIEKKDN